MAQYPSTPYTIGDKIGANLCPRPTFNDATMGAWSGGSISATTIDGVSRNRLIPPTGGVSTITLPGVAVTPGQAFKITIRYRSQSAAGAVGVRPVGSSRINADNLPVTSTNYVWPSNVITDTLQAGDTGTAVELYVKSPAAGGLSFAWIRVDYADGYAPGTTGGTFYFDGDTTDTTDVGYAWDGTAYNSTTSATALTGVAGDTGPPTAPTNLRVAEPTLWDQITLAWDAATDDIGVTGYNLYTGLTLSTKVNSQPLTGLTYTDTGYVQTSPLGSTLTHNTARYAVTALDAAGHESVKSTALDAAPDNRPNAPANQHLVSRTTNSLTIAWDAGVDDNAVTGYWVYVHDDTPDPNDAADYIANAAPVTDLTYTITGLRSGHTYLINVASIDGKNQESWQHGHNPDTLNDAILAAGYQITATTASANQAPTAPTNLTATVGETTVALSWSLSSDPDNVDVRPSYRVYEGGSLVGSTDSTPNYTVTGLAPDSTHTYTVRAVDTTDSTLESADSAPITVTTNPTPPPPDTTPPTAPTGLAETSHTDTSISLQWLAATDDVGVTGYKVYDGTTALGTVTALGYTHSGLSPQSSHTYTVTALDAAGNESPASNAVTITTDATPPQPPAGDLPPTAPTGLTVRTTDTTADLQWLAATDDFGVAGYDVYLGSTKINADPINALGYTILGLTAGTTYTFGVRSVDTVGQVSAVTSASATTTGTAPPAPTGAVTGTTVASFLMQADNTALIDTANPAADIVTQLAKAYTRGQGFTNDVPNAELHAVITAAAARLAAHPEQIPMTVGSVTYAGGFDGWTLPELFVLNRYRKRWT